MKTVKSLSVGISACLLLSAASAEKHSNEEVSFFKGHAFPFVQKVSRLPQLPFERVVQTNDVLKWRCDYVWNTGEMTGVFLSLTNKRFLDLRVKDTNCTIWHFADGNVNPLGIAGREDSAKAKFYSEMPNQFTSVSALAFAEAFAKAVSDDLGNFRLVKSWQIAWGSNENKTNYFPLPFYEFQWLEKNITEPEPGALCPSINIIVSGISKKVVSYDRLQMPVVTDEAFRKRYSTNSSDLYQPTPQQGGSKQD